MFENKDRIARPAQGRFFPVTVAETVKLVQGLEFTMPSPRKQLNIKFRNPDGTGAYGIDVAALSSSGEIIIYSLPEDFDRLRVREILEKALREFAELSKCAKSADRHRMSLSLRAYFKPQAKLIFTKRTRRATLAKYRGSMKFSHAFKPKGVKTDEQVVCSINVT